MKQIIYLLILGLPVLAHEGPEHDIEELTERISIEGESANLLLQRAVEYQVIRNYKAAVEDLERALQLEPRSPAVQRELGRAYFATGKMNEALQVVSRGLEQSVRGADRATLLMVRAEVLRARKEPEKALADAEEAIREYPGDVEWHLFRSQLQAALGLKSERVADLERGLQQTGSGLLRIEWIDALIEAGRLERALQEVETELAASRLRSSWLIRRARILLASGKEDAAKADLTAALEELNARMTSAAPDPSLLADRGTVHDLLGDKESARKDYSAAKDKGVTDEWLIERIRELKDQKD